MRIGYFVGSFPDQNLISNYKYGGGERVAYNIAVNIAKRGHNVYVFTTSESSKDEIVNLSNNIKVYKYATLFKFYRRNIALSLLIKPDVDVDIVHVHIAGEIIPIAALRFARKKGLPLIATYHGDAIADRLLYKLGEKLHNLIIKEVLNFSSVIISPSKHVITQSTLLYKYRDKIIVLPNGINLKDFEIPYSKEECRKRLGIHNAENIILFVGVLRAFKGVDILIRAMQLIVKEIQNTQLMIVGEGEMRVELEKLTKKLGLERNIVFTGFINETLKPIYYKAADIFCLPSVTTQEIFGIVNLEAMACGVPIVASRIGGIPDVVKNGKNGLLVPPKDHNALANAIIYLLKNEDIRQKMGREGKKIVKGYTWEKITEAMETVYELVINER